MRPVLPRRTKKGRPRNPGKSPLPVRRHAAKSGHGGASGSLRLKYKNRGSFAPAVTNIEKRSQAKTASGGIERLGFTEKELRIIEELKRSGTYVKAANVLLMTDSALRSALYRLRRRYLNARDFLRRYERIRRSFPPNKKFLSTGISKIERLARERRSAERAAASGGTSETNAT